MSVILNAINYLWKLGFNEEKSGFYTKLYPVGHIITIDVRDETINYGPGIIVKDKDLLRLSQKSYIILETVDRILRKGYGADSIQIGLDLAWDVLIKCGRNDVFMAFKCLEWEEEYDASVKKVQEEPNQVSSFYEKNPEVEWYCLYTSRLKAGTIECRYSIYPKTYQSVGFVLNEGIFEAGIATFPKRVEAQTREALGRDGPIKIGDFIVHKGELIKYTGRSSEVIIPDGIEKLQNSVFWNRSEIERVVLPNTLFSMGGDTFNDCENLVELTIPESVQIIGDNPFANCPKLVLVNKSPHFKFEDGALYNKEMTRIIYCSIERSSDVMIIPDGVISISKHTFYNCNKLRRITIPSSAKIMENNPFSNLPDMRIENHSPHFILRDGAMYNKAMTTLSYFEHSSGVENLVIPEGVSIIGRHSFYNCQTIRSITIPSSIEQIGYNPFARCGSLSLVNHSPNYIYENGALYNRSKTELVYYSIPSQNKTFKVPDNVRKIGRSAFLEAKNLTKIRLPEGLRTIERSAFYSCERLAEVNIPHSVENIATWAFANCPKLVSLDISKNTTIEPLAFLDSPTTINRMGC